MLAALSGYAQGTFASEVAVEGDSVKVTREIDGGLQTVSVTMPTVITVDLRLNEPRYASLPNIMKAKKKPLDEKTAADYGVDVTPRLEVLKTATQGITNVAASLAKMAELKQAEQQAAKRQKKIEALKLKLTLGLGDESKNKQALEELLDEEN